MRNRILLAILPVLACFALLPRAHPITPESGPCEPNFNTPEGCESLNSVTTGAGNTAMGWWSLSLDTTGDFNTGVGAGALFFNNANSNTAVGAASLLFNTIGTQNTGVGTGTLLYNDSDSPNTATGNIALEFNTTGGSNTATGSEALNANTTGNNNIALGNQVLFSSESTSDHVALGSMAGFGITSADNNIIIGHHSGVHSVFGEESDRCYIDNIFGATVSVTTAVPVFVDSDGRLGTFVSWVAGNSYPTTIGDYGFAETATHFYVFGGVSDGNRVNNVSRYNLSTGMWESRASMPFTSAAPTCSLMEATGIVYCAEGDTGHAFASYNIATDTWTSLASTPNQDDYGSASGAFNGKVFLAGGTTGFSNSVWVYDVASNSWSAGTPAPVGPFQLAGYHQIGQFLYVVGGFAPSAINLNTTLRLDMSSAPGTWETGPTFAPQLAEFGLAYDPGTNKLYSLGGDLPNGGSTNQVNELDVSAWPAGTWNPSPPNLPQPVRQGNSAGFYGNGDIWSVGGFDATDPAQSLNEVWHRNNQSPVSPRMPPPIAPLAPAKADTKVEGPDPGGFSPKGIRGQGVLDAASQAMLNLKVQNLRAMVPQQRQQIETLTAQVKEQVAQIQKLNVQLKMNKPATKVIVRP